MNAAFRRPAAPIVGLVMRTAFVVALGIGIGSISACKRSEPPPDLLKSQRDAMERAKDVGNTMQKSVDQEGRKADEEGK